MQKIPSLYKRNYDGNRQVYDEVVLGSEWVLNGEGVATVKIDGTCCKVENGLFLKRYDRKLSKNAKRKLKQGSYTPKIEDYKSAPEGWQPAEPEPNQHTGHWPGWMQVNPNLPEDKYHWEAWGKGDFKDGTFELVGVKIQGNPYNMKEHQLLKHGEVKFDQEVPRTFEELQQFLEESKFAEGIVWHHPDGRMVKIKRRDFGYKWPVI